MTCLCNDNPSDAPAPEDTHWYGPCNTDNIMSDNGDQEELINMLMVIHEYLTQL